MKKLTGFIVKLLPLGLLLGLCIALSGCGKMQRINLNDLMSYEITGYSGQGKLTWDLDDQKFAEQRLSGIWPDPGGYALPCARRAAFQPPHENLPDRSKTHLYPV